MCLLQASDAHTAQVVKVVPTPNNGYTELVTLQKQKVCLVVLNTVWHLSRWHLLLVTSVDVSLEEAALCY